MRVCGETACRFADENDPHLSASDPRVPKRDPRGTVLTPNMSPGNHLTLTHVTRTTGFFGPSGVPSPTSEKIRLATGRLLPTIQSDCANLFDPKPPIGASYNNSLTLCHPPQARHPFNKGYSAQAT